MYCLFLLLNAELQGIQFVDCLLALHALLSLKHPNNLPDDLDGELLEIAWDDELRLKRGAQYVQRMEFHHDDAQVFVALGDM